MSMELTLIEEIRVASRTLVREWGFMGKTLGGTGYSPSIVHTLVEMEAQGTMTAAQLVQVLNLEKSSVSRMVGKLIKEGLLQEATGGEDGRVKRLTLTEKGKAAVVEINTYSQNQVAAALEKLNSPQRQAVVEGLAVYGQALKTCRLGEPELAYQSGVTAESRPQQGNLQIIPFETKYQRDFKALNEEWITKWFKMEAADYKALDHPQEYILDKGGFIFIALLDGQPVGACALIKMDETNYEMAKMAVSDQAKGQGIGFLLGQAIVNRARILGAKRLYLESNTQLKPAINLYRKLGFEEVHGYVSPYERCDIQMQLALDEVEAQTTLAPEL